MKSCVLQAERGREGRWSLLALITCQVRPEPAFTAALQGGTTEQQLSPPSFSVLHQVKSELHVRWESNQELVSSIRDRLAQHSSQLMDLRDALNEAVNKTRQTEDLNSLNRNNLEESQVELCQMVPFCHVLRGGLP